MSDSVSVPEAAKPVGRIWAPFGRFSAKVGRGEARRRQIAFFDHGYKQPGEHYHETFDELLDCDLFGDEPHLHHLRVQRGVSWL